MREGVKAWFQSKTEHNAQGCVLNSGLALQARCLSWLVGSTASQPSHLRAGMAQGFLPLRACGMELALTEQGQSVSRL